MCTPKLNSLTFVNSVLKSAVRARTKQQENTKHSHETYRFRLANC